MNAARKLEKGALPIDMDFLNRNTPGAVVMDPSGEPTMPDTSKYFSDGKGGESFTTEDAANKVATLTPPTKKAPTMFRPVLGCERRAAGLVED